VLALSMIYPTLGLGRWGVVGGWWLVWWSVYCFGVFLGLWMLGLWGVLPLVRLHCAWVAARGESEPSCG